MQFLMKQTHRVNHSYKLQITIHCNGSVVLVITFLFYNKYN